MSSSLKAVAQHTLAILKSGEYTTATGKTVRFQGEIDAAVSNTRLYTPEQAAALLAQNGCGTAAPIIKAKIEVTSETTQVAAHRLVHDEGCNDLVLLNYASARNAGGGFIRGAKAQEEDVCRCSALHPCLLTQPGYYNANRNQRSMLYTDHIIYSPQIPFFRTRSRDAPLPYTFCASVITAPAPNAGEALRRDPNAHDGIAETLKRRAGVVLAIARDNGHRTVLLGAWGCGVFRNDPEQMATVFKDWLLSPQFAGCFERVVFGVYDPRKDKQVLGAFQRCFGV